MAARFASVFRAGPTYRDVIASSASPGAPGRRSPRATAARHWPVIGTPRRMARRNDLTAEQKSAVLEVDARRLYRI